MDKITKIIGIIIVCLFLVGAAIDTHETIPDNAIVWGDDTEKKYYGDHTWKEMNDEWSRNKEKSPLEQIKERTLKRNVKKMTIKEARSLEYEADNKSINNGDFAGESCSLTYAFLQRIGVMPKKSRWNSDGTWNY